MADHREGTLTCTIYSTPYFHMWVKHQKQLNIARIHLASWAAQANKKARQSFHTKINKYNLLKTWCIASRRPQAFSFISLLLSHRYHTPAFQVSPLAPIFQHPCSMTQVQSGGVGTNNIINNNGRWEDVSKWHLHTRWLISVTNEHDIH